MDASVGFTAQQSHLKIVVHLLKSGAFADAQSDKEETALVISAWAGHTEIVRELVKHGTSLDLICKQVRIELR